MECWGGLTLENCVIIGNGGAGVLVEESSGATLTGCTLSDNGDRGVIYRGYSSIVITDCTITGNTNGGVWVEDGAFITGCTIMSNYGGGGIFLNSGGTVTDSLIKWNSSSNHHGAGICSWGTVTVTNCDILGNYAYGSAWGEGGGIWYVYGSPVITGCRIIGNQADKSGGGIATSENHMRDLRGDEGAGRRAATISGNLITNNYAPDSSGGAIYCDGMGQMNLTNNLITDNVSKYSPIINYSSNSMTIRHCTIAGNRATGSTTTVGGVYSSRPLVVENSILWGNISSGGAQAGVWNGALSISYSDVQGGQAGVYLGTGGTLDWGLGMVDADPLFAVGLTHDFYLGQVAAGQPVDSPCVDAGSGPAASICYPAPGGTVCLDQLTTRLDHQWADQWQADLGYHASFFPGLDLVAAELTCLPAAGTLPFDFQMGVSLTNHCSLLIRQIAGRIDLTLGNGQSFSSWRAGWTNIGPGSSYQITWSQNLPFIGPVLGGNHFTLLAEDVTPSPYNQAPYPPSGSTASDGCMVEGGLPDPSGAETGLD